MSIPRVALMVAFGLISSSGRTDEFVARAAAAPAQTAKPQSNTIRVRLLVVPEETRSKGEAGIQNWALERDRRDTIQPTDIIFDGSKVWMFIHGRLVPHAHELQNKKHNYHFELGAVHLSVSRGEQIVWESEKEFCVVSIKKDTHGPTAATAPPNPFPKLRAAAGKACGNRVESGPAELKDSQMPQRYKATFRITGEKNLLDPDIVCEP